MKLVKEYINEKFTDESDPIQDMGIGIEHILKDYYEKFFLEDKKSNFEYADSDTASHWEPSSTMFRYIDVSRDILTVVTYHNIHRDTKTKRLINNVAYTKKLLNKINILPFMTKDIKTSNASKVTVQCTEIKFHIKPKYIKFFEQNRYFPE
jgi:hypothetical protein